MIRPTAPAFHLSTLALALALLIACALALAPSPAAADGIIIPVPPRDQPIPWREVPLVIKYHRVAVEITDQVATTHVDQVFVNEASYPIEGTYIFPLPEDAAISSFDMWVDGQKLEGKLLGRDEARAIYEEIVRKQRDPALLEYVGRGAFQASIFPIPSHGERRIELTYTQVLSQTDGLVHYRYPLNTEKFSARDIAEVAITVKLEDQSPLRAIYSPSHTVQVVREDDGRATISYEARNVRPDRDFDLYYGLSVDAIAVNLLSYKTSDEDGFFLLLVTPPVEADADAVVAKDVVLVLDTSGSMDGDKLIQAKAAADYVLDHLGANDRFNIVAFSSAPRVFADGPVPAARAAEGHAFIRRLTAAGSTDINRALLEALAGARAERPTVVIFLTDGLPTVGEENPDRIVENVRTNAAKSVRLFAFGVGYDVDTVLLDQLSSNQRGLSSYVQPGQKIDEVVSEFYGKVSTPVLVELSAVFSGVQVDDLYPYPLPDLFAGSQLVVAGRYRQGAAADLILSGEVNGQPQATTYRNLNFVARGGQDFIARLWAQRKIGYLLSQIRLRDSKTMSQGALDELVKEVVALSTRYGIITPYTSFLVEEPQLALSQGGRDQLGHAASSTAAPVGAGGIEPAMMAPDERSGQRAVQTVVVESALKSSEQAAAAPASGEAGQVVRQAGSKTFLLNAGVWVDTVFDLDAMQAEKVLFGSERYFELLAQYPEIGPYLALGDRVTVVLAGHAYAIGPEGATAAASSTPTQAQPTPTVARTVTQPTETVAPTSTTDQPAPQRASVTPPPAVTPLPAPALRGIGFWLALLVGLIVLGGVLAWRLRAGRRG